MQYLQTTNIHYLIVFESHELGHGLARYLQLRVSHKAAKSNLGCSHLKAGWERIDSQAQSCGRFQVLDKFYMNFTTKIYFNAFLISLIVFDKPH